MQPQSGRKKPKHPVLGADANRIPVTVLGQRYVAPAGRHSQQSHLMAQQRAVEAGHASEKEQHAHDKLATTTRIAKTAANLQANKEKSAQK